MKCPRACVGRPHGLAWLHTTFCTSALLTSSRISVPGHFAHVSETLGSFRARRSLSAPLLRRQSAQTRTMLRKRTLPSQPLTHFFPSTTPLPASGRLSCLIFRSCLFEPEPLEHEGLLSSILKTSGATPVTLLEVNSPNLFEITGGRLHPYKLLCLPYHRHSRNRRDPCHRGCGASLSHKTLAASRVSVFSPCLRRRHRTLSPS